MRVQFSRYYFLLTVAVILTVYTFSASAVPAKDHKKKLLDKLRNSLNQTEAEEAPVVTVEGAAENVTAEAAEAAEAKGVEPEESDKSEDDGEEGGEDDKKSGDDEKSGDGEKSGEGEKPESSAELQKTEGPTSYLLKMRSMLRRIFDMFGFRQGKKKEGRQNRMLGGDDAYNYNGLEYEYFRDDIRTTVGAVLGEKACIQKIVCGAGSYLRDVNGKHVILTILENVTPSAWTETMELLKKSAVTDGDCVYKCLESENDKKKK